MQHGVLVNQLLLLSQLKAKAIWQEFDQGVDDEGSERENEDDDPLDS